MELIRKFENYNSSKYNIHNLYVVYHYLGESLSIEDVFTSLGEAQKIADEQNKQWEEYIKKSSLTNHVNPHKAIPLDKAINMMIESAIENINVGNIGDGYV